MVNKFINHVDKKLTRRVYEELTLVQRSIQRVNIENSHLGEAGLKDGLVGE